MVTSNSSSSASSRPQEQLRDTEIYIHNKNIAAFWVLLSTQILYSFMYGFFGDLSAGASQQIYNEAHFVHTALLFVLIIIGFGMIFGYYAKLGWSALGFNLLITALVIETYFLVNAFWTKTQLKYTGQDFQLDTKFYIYLTPYDQTINGQSLANQYQAVLTQALKCSLACIIAFSYILGRAGPLQAYFVAVLGATVYELTRQICLIRSQYESGSLKIFLFGSTFGLMLSILMRRSQATIKNNFNHRQNSQSIMSSLIGLLIFWVLFPLLSYDSYTGYTYPTLNDTNARITEPLIICTMLSIASATVIGIIFSFLQFGFKSVITCSLAGGIVALSSSAYITNPVYAIMWGIVAALFQQLILYFDHKIITHLKGPIDSFNFVFLAQGILALAISTANRAIVLGNSNNLTLIWSASSADPGLYFGNGWVFAAIGLALGILLGLLFSCCTYHEQIDHFNDHTYWCRHDGISMGDQSQQQISSRSSSGMKVVERSRLKDNHAYL